MLVPCSNTERLSGSIVASRRHHTERLERSSSEADLEQTIHATRVRRMEMVTDGLDTAGIMTALYGARSDETKTGQLQLEAYIGLTDGKPIR